MSIAGHPTPVPDATRMAATVELRVGIAVRAAAMEDLETVLRLRLALIRESAENAIFGRVRADAEARARELYALQLSSDREVTLIAEREGRALGIIRCVESAGSPLLEPSRYCYVSSAYVVPRFRRRGVLRRLIAAADSWCRERGLTEMRLHNIAESDLANHTWETLGFAVTEIVRIRRLPDAPAR